MNNELGRKVEELRREAEVLKAHRRDRAQNIRAGKTQESGALDPGLAVVGDDIKEAIGDLENAFNQLSEMTEEKIAQRPIVSLAVAFAIGVLIGRLTKS